jgi:hypothetical protein
MHEVQISVVELSPISCRHGNIDTFHDAAPLWKVELRNPEEVIPPELLYEELKNVNFVRYIIAPDSLTAHFLAIKTWNIYNPEELSPDPLISVERVAEAVLAPSNVHLRQKTFVHWSELSPEQLELVYTARHAQQVDES